MSKSKGGCAALIVFGLFVCIVTYFMYGSWIGGIITACLSMVFVALIMGNLND